MSPEFAISQIVKLDTKELRRRMAQAWRNIRRDHPELARRLWQSRKQQETVQ